MEHINIGDRLLKEIPSKLNPVQMSVFNDKTRLFGIFFIALIFHVSVYYALFAKAADFSKYHLFAHQYLQGMTSPERQLDFSPLYLFINIVMQKYVPHPAEVMLWLQFIAVSGACVCMFILLRSFFTTPISLVGTAAFLSSRSIVLYTSVNEPEAFLVFFLLCFIVCVMRKSDAMAILAGISLGLCLCIRLNLIPLLAATPLYFMLNREKTGKSARRIFFFIAPALFAVMILMIRNHAITGSFNPAVMNPGYVFFEGNNPNANGQNAVYPPMVDNVIEEFSNESDAAHEVYRVFPRRLTGKRLSIADVNSFWSSKAMNFIVDHPLIWARRFLNKLIYIVHNARWHDIASVVSNDLVLQKTMVPTIPFGLISALALIGMALSLKAWRERFVFYAVVFCQIGVMALTYCSDRQRVSFIALFVFFASATLHAILNKSHPWQVRAILVVAVLALLPFLFLKDDLFADSLYVRSQFELAQNAMNEASLARQNGNLQEASEKNALAYAQIPYLIESRLSGLRFSPRTYEERALCIAESIHVNSKAPSPRLDLITLYLQNGKTREAEIHALELIRTKRKFNRNTTQSSQPYFYLARIEEMSGNKPAAIDHLQKALRSNPGDPWDLAHLGVLTEDSIFEKRISRYFDEIDAKYFLGLACLDNNMFTDAANSFSFVVNEVPEYRDGFIYLALALGGEKDFVDAERYYTHAMQRKREPLFREQEILSIFRGFMENDPRNENARFLLAMTLQDFGHYEEAKKIFTELRERNPP
jgi:tetratricopeptide (TPR) repeat protein